MKAQPAKGTRPTNGSDVYKEVGGLLNERRQKHELDSSRRTELYSQCDNMLEELNKFKHL